MSKEAETTGKVRRSIDPDTDFTCSELARFLNEVFGAKKTGNEFTNQDVYSYSRRGKLPDEYGGFRIQRIKVPDVGVTVMRIKEVDDLKEMKGVS